MLGEPRCLSLRRPDRPDRISLHNCDCCGRAQICRRSESSGTLSTQPRCIPWMLLRSCFPLIWLLIRGSHGQTNGVFPSTAPAIYHQVGRIHLLWPVSATHNPCMALSCWDGCATVNQPQRDWHLGAYHRGTDGEALSDSLTLLLAQVCHLCFHRRDGLRSQRGVWGR